MRRKELKKLAVTLKNNWRIAVVVIIMMAVSGYILAGYGLRKHYITTTDIYIESTDDIPSYEKAKTVALLFTSPMMYDEINNNLKTRFSYAELGKLINVEQKNGTQIISVSFDCETSSESYKLAEMYLTLLQRVIDGYEGANAEAKVMSPPVEPQKPAFPDELMFTIAGAAIGFIVSVTGLIVIWKLDNTITAADNIEEEYNVPVIGELMDFDNEIDYLGR